MTHEQPDSPTATEMSRWLALQDRAHSAFELRLVAVEDWTAPTPDTEWDVRALVLHVVREQQRAHTLLSGATSRRSGSSRSPLICAANGDASQTV